MQALAGTVQCQCAVILGNVDVQLYVGVYDTYVWTVAGLLAELVNDSVLHLVGNELGVLELVAENHAVHGKGGVVAQILCPVYLFYGVIYLVGGLCLEVADGLEDTYGSAQLEVGAVHSLPITRKGHHAASYLNVVGSQVY